MTTRLIKVALPVPIADGFDYLWTHGDALPTPGTRVEVPFGRSRRVGIVIDHPTASELPAARLRAAYAALDAAPLLTDELLETLRWAADYYHHPLGEVLSHALPGMLRKGRPVEAARERLVRLTAAGRDQGAGEVGVRAARQAEALRRLAAGPVPVGVLRAEGISADTLRRLTQKGWIETLDAAASAASVFPASASAASASAASASAASAASAAAAAAASASAVLAAASTPAAAAAPPLLTPDQQRAVDTVRASRGTYAAFVLFGVTGSGKTEVFLRLVADELAAGRQSLLLVPEIGLTPQLVSRLRDRFGDALAVMHSGLSDGERLDAWRRARDGRAGVVVGTRSAVLAPLSRPGLIVVDEEHDPSYKQQQGFHYSARDIAVLRARRLGVPIVLASATPSLESFHNAESGRYTLIEMPQRIGAAGTPRVRTIDLTRHAQRHGLSTPLIETMERHLADERQVLLFLNRRGFAPTLYCPNCRKLEECRRCDARLTVHASAGELRCHHCAAARPLAWGCPDCGEERVAVGAGTQRVDDLLKSMFPERPIGRLDRDTTARKGALDEVLAGAASGDTRIVVGTQMLTKGHDFPNVTLVGVLNADQGLFGTDFRADERLAQTLLQVAGRAGRRDTPGEVLIQTHYPEHPLLTTLLTEGYGAFARVALDERRRAGWPPFSHLAVWRAEATQRAPAAALLDRVRRRAAELGRGVDLRGPAPAAMERRGGRYRMQLLMRSESRAPLHAVLKQLIPETRDSREARRARWSVDVDPLEL